MPIREQLIRVSPVRFVVVLLTTVFVSEAGIMLVLPVMLSTYTGSLLEAGVDASLLVVILAPVLWWMIVRPLQRGAVSEEQRATRLVAILEATPDLVGIADPEGQVVYLNRAGRRMLGIDELVHLTKYNIREFHDAANAHVVLTVGIPAAMRDGTWSGETELVALDGHSIAISQVIAAHKAPNGTLTFLSTIARDITERKRAEREIENIAKFPSENPNPILRVDRNGALLYSNEAGVRQLPGWNLQPGETLPIWLTRIVSQVMDDGSGRVVELEAQGRTYSFLLVPIVDASYVNLYGHDITERKLAEKSLRLESAALRAVTDTIVITDRACVIERVNPAFTQLTGYTAEEAFGKNLGNLVKSGKQTPAFYKDLWETILAGRTWRGEMVNRRKDGRLYTEDQAVAPIRDASGAITHFVAIKRDITERLQLEAQFRQAQKMESVGRLASGIAHDFNNLLTVINGMAEFVLAQVSQDSPAHADVREIYRAGEQAARLTRQLLAFSRQQILEPRVLNCNTVVAGTESLLRRLLGEDIDLVVVPTPDLGPVLADSGQIEQVIINLAVNARDAMPQGGHLTIETENVTTDEDYARQHGVAMPSGSYVQIAVSDSGVGMDEATRERIFEPFFTTKGPGKGTGLGLSTVYGIVKQSHGFIWVCSEVGRGTSFQILLPQVAEAAGTDRRAPSVVSNFGTETILLVEDNDGLRKLVTRMLEPAGYTVLGATTGEEALRLLERREEPVHLLLSPVDLLLTDVVMPGMSGRHLAERVAQTHPAMKVLYMSGYTSDTIMRHGVLEAHMFLLNKPFTAAALLRRVREVLDSQA